MLFVSEDESRLVIDANDDDSDDGTAQLPNRSTVIGSRLHQHDRTAAKKARLLDSDSEHEDKMSQGSRRVHCFENLKQGLFLFFGSSGTLGTG